MDLNFKNVILSFFFSIGSWLLFIYDYYYDRPIFRGDITYAFSGKMPMRNDTISLIYIYPYFTNEGKRQLCFFDFELEVDFGDTLLKYDCVYDIDENKIWNFGKDTTKYFNDLSLFKKGTLVNYGELLHGFLVFYRIGATPSNHNIKLIKLECTDVFDVTYNLSVSPKEMDDILLFNVLSGLNKAELKN